MISDDVIFFDNCIYCKETSLRPPEPFGQAKNAK
jgi:hypothetical protein